MLLRREFRMNYRNYIMIGAFIFGIYFMFFLFGMLFGASPGNKVVWIFFKLFLIVGGAYFASLSFADIKRPVGYFYLTIPASNFEKVLTKWVVTLVGWVVAYSLVYFLFTFIGKLMIFAVHQEGDILISFKQVSWELVLTYLSTHAVFFFGASLFKKNSFILTIVAISVISMIITVITFIVAKVVHWNLDLINLDLIMNLDSIWLIFEIITILTLWTLSFVRLRKTQL